ncbi:hypothetical protein N0V84_012738, partial [Fusarium piperis]
IHDDTSGIDTLVQIIRKTNVDSVNYMMTDDSRNPILAYFRTDFPLTFSSKELRQHHLEKKVLLIHELSAKIPSGFSFDSLCISNLMR